MSVINRLSLALAAAALLAGCGNGTVIGSGPGPTPSPVTPSVTFEYTVPTAGSRPATLASGPDGYIYFTEQGASKLGRMSTGGSFSELATTNASPNAITVGPDNAMWFTEYSGHVGSVTTGFTSNSLHEYTVPWANSTPNFISRGVLSNTLYFTDVTANAIGRVAVGGTFGGPYAIPTGNANPQGIAIGPDNRMWFTEYNAAKIGVLDPTNNTIAEYPVTAGSNPDIIVQGPDGAMWFTENVPGAPKLGRMTSTHQYAEFPLANAQSAVGLAVDLFGDLVIADATKSAIGVFSIGSQTFTEYPTKTASAEPLWNAIGPDGKIYFTEYAAGKIGQFTYF